MCNCVKKNHPDYACGSWRCQCHTEVESKEEEVNPEVFNLTVTLKNVSKSEALEFIIFLSGISIKSNEFSIDYCKE